MKRCRPAPRLIPPRCRFTPKGDDNNNGDDNNGDDNNGDDVDVDVDDIGEAGDSTKACVTTSSCDKQENKTN